MRDGMNEIEVSNRKYTLYKEGRIEVYDHTIANRLNALLSTYPDYRFKKQPKEEPTFRFAQNQKAQVLAAIRGF